MVLQKTETCSACQHDLSAVPLDHLIRRQVLDLPPPRVMVTEYLLECKRCPQC